MGSDGDQVQVDGYTFWRTREGGRGIEMTTATGIEVDADRCRWTVAAPGGGAAGEPVESGSRDVRRFMLRVVGAMQRATHRGPVRPVPKPGANTNQPVPATALVACPLCRGESWPPGCEVCGGAGAVTQRIAAEWHQRHD